MIFAIPILAVILLGNITFAHPGRSVAEEATERAEFFKQNPRTVKSCARQLTTQGHKAASLHRRIALFNDLISKRHRVPERLDRRDFSTYNFSHASDDATISSGSDGTALLNDNSSCILQPEVTQGPYYVNGELIRQNLAEGQDGVPLFLDIQLIGVATCEPVPAMFIDIWACNSTGVYSGVSASGNGNSNDAANLDATFLRGIQQTDQNGHVQFHTIFPGHYAGRTNHIHLLAHTANHTTVRSNNTLLGLNATTVQASHVGQIFFDQGQITRVENTYPYTQNTQEVTTNAQDEILIAEADVSDPFIEYMLPGDTSADGVFAWISVGIDPRMSDEISSAVTYFENGGVPNVNDGMGG